MEICFAFFLEVYIMTIYSRERYITRMTGNRIEIDIKERGYHEIFKDVMFRVHLFRLIN